MFPPGTGRREVAVQAVGNLIAAYAIFIAACIVGVGGCTPNLQYYLVLGTVLMLNCGMSSWLGNSAPVAEQPLSKPA